MFNIQDFGIVSELLFTLGESVNASSSVRYLKVGPSMHGKRESRVCMHGWVMCVVDVCLGGCVCECFWKRVFLLNIFHFAFLYYRQVTSFFLFGWLLN